MKYLLINDMYVAGGTEVQSKREMEYFSSVGIEVKYITLDPNFAYHESKQKNHLNIARYKNSLLRIMDRYLLDKQTFLEIKQIIAEFDPDFIHLNNIYLSAPAVYEAVKDHYCFQTIRDFSIVCVKSTCILPDCSVCTGSKDGHCFRKCFPKTLKDFVIFVGRYIALSRNAKLKKKAINQFVCPSQSLTDYCISHGYPTICVNNPFDFTVIKEFQKSHPDNGKLIFIYYGVISEKKGVLRLIDAFNEFAKNLTDVELHIVGKLDGLSEARLLCGDKIKYFGFMPFAQIIKKLEEVYAVIVPSVWIENYPNTVLEGFATDCVVIGSNRGGIPEQIGDQKCLFDVMDQDDIIRRLNYVYGLSEEERIHIYDRQKAYLKSHNRQEDYFSRILKIVEKGKEHNNGTSNSCNLSVLENIDL